MHRVREKKGFTLLEVMITLVILSVGMLGLASMQIMAIKGNSFGQRLSIASTLAQNKLEELRQVEFDSIADGNDVCTDQINRVSYNRQWTVQNDAPQPEMKTIEVKVRWMGSEAERSVSYSTIISRL